MIAAATETIPVARPLLPKADRIAPYLAKIDHARWYSNRGPLIQALETRLETFFGAPRGAVATAANATLGLAAAIAVMARGDGPFCLTPAWTFAATGHAIRVAGFTPLLVDVSPETGQLDLDAAAAEMRARPGQVAAAVAVSPFGAPVPHDAIAAFMEAQGVPVIIDAAAAFDAIRPSPAAAVVSLHATKTLGAGEGAFVISPDAAAADAIRRYVNFGFDRDRVAAGPGLNAKMSEYAAAVAHAALDDWAATRGDWLRVAQTYRARLAGAPRIAWPAGLGAAWASASLVVRLVDTAAGPVIAALRDRGVEARAWWGAGLHRQPAFADAPRGRLPATDRFAAHSLGLPCFRDMTDEQVASVCAQALNSIRG